MIQALTYCGVCGKRTPLSALDILGRCVACRPAKPEKPGK